MGQLRWGPLPTLPGWRSGLRAVTQVTARGWVADAEGSVDKQHRLNHRACVCTVQGGGTCPAAREPTPQGAAWRPARGS